MKIFNKKAVSVIEYSLLFIIIIGAFLVMRSSIQRGLYGTWAKAGQSFAFGRQFDSEKTIECSFDATSSRWYDRNCYKAYITNAVCNGSQDCQEAAITSCASSSCNQLNNGASP